MLKNKKIIAVILLLVLGGIFMFSKKDKSYKVNDKIAGFSLKEKQKVDSATGGIAYLFEHENTKGKVLYVKNNDNHKTFSIFFKAPTTDSTGVSHIMEHSVLAGSQKYRGKDPFFEYFQTSPHSFMNAMTWQNIVWYPFSTLYDQNFSDLMDIYLDSVFHPLLKKETFMREGWRYNFDEDEKLVMNGTVYNEMKEAYASVGRQLYMSGLESLFGKYYCSGGDPEKIGDLTYTDFKDYHEKYYNPSNSIAYFYGDGDIFKHLEKLNSVYKKYEKQSQVKINFPTVKGKKITSTYPSAKGETKSHLAYFYSIGKSNDFVAEEKAKSLGYLMAGYEDAPLKKALVQTDLANEISVDVMGIQGNLILMIQAEGIEKKNKEKIQIAYKKALKKIVEIGFSNKAIQATISTAKFNLKHRVKNEGLDLDDELFRNFLHDDSMFSFLQKNKIFAEYKKDLAKKDAFENLVKNWILKNKEGFVLLNPDPKWVEKEENKLDKKLQKIQKNFSKDELKKIKKEIENFAESEKKPEKPTPLPNMSVSSMPKKVESVNTQIAKVNEVEIFYHPIVNEGENKVLRVYFDLVSIPKKLIPFLGIYIDIANKFSPKNTKLSDFVFEQKIKLGRTLSFSEDAELFYGESGFSANLIIGGEVLPESTDFAFDIINKFLFDLDFSNKEKLKGILERSLSEQEMFYRQNGRPLLRRANQKSSFEDTFHGFEFYKFLKNIVENFDSEYENILLAFEEIRNTVFVSSELTISVVAPEKDYKKTLSSIEKFTKLLPKGEEEKSQKSYAISLENEAVIVPKRTQANQIVMQAFDKKDMKDLANWIIMTKIFTGEYLLPEIRFKGGAYGTGSGISPNGQLLLMSRADPKLAETYDVFDKLPNAFEKIELPEKRLEGYKLKTLASVFSPQTPSQKAHIVAKRFFSHLSLEDRQIIYDATRTFSKKDIKPYLIRLRQLLENKTRATQGSKEQIEKNKKLFDKIYEGLDN